MPSRAGPERKPRREGTRRDSGKGRQEPGPSAPRATRKLYGTAAALGLLAVLLFVHQYTTMARFAVIPPGLRFTSFSKYLSIIFARIEFAPLDYALLAAIAGLFLGLMVAEHRGGCLSALLRWVFTGEGRTIALLGAAGFVAVRFYIGSGYFPWGGDQPQHICFSHMASRSIAEGELPIWTNYLGTGTPYLQFYGFLFFYLTGLVDQLWTDIFASLKAVMAVLHAASGLAMYLLARTVTRSRVAGFIAGLAYVLSFWHTQQVIIMGRFPLSLFYALLPLPFYFFERLSSPGPAGHRARLASSLAGGICLGALALTHPGYAFWATVLLGLYIGLRLLLEIPAGERPGLAGWSAVLLAGGLVFGGYLTLPMWLERDYTGLYRGLDLSGIPAPTWQHVLAWSNYRFWAILPPGLVKGNWYGGYLGLTLAIAVAAAAAVSLLSRSRKLILRSLPALCCLVLTVLIVFGYHWSLFESIPIVKMMGAGRYLLFTVFFLALAAGPAVQALMVLLRRRRWRVPVSTLILCGIAVDLGPTTFQQVYFAGDLGAGMFPQIRAQADSLDAHGQLPNFRVLWNGSKRGENLLKGQLYFDTRAPRPGSFHPGRSRPAVDFVKPVDQYLSKLVEMGYFAIDDSIDAGLQGQFPETLFGRNHGGIVLAGLTMMDVRYHILSNLEEQISIGDLGETGSHGPVLVSSKIEPFPRRGLDQLVASGEPFSAMESEGVDPGFTKMLTGSYHALFLVANTGVDPVTRVCERIYVLDSEGRELGTNPAVEVLEHTVRMQRVDLKLRVSEACFARLAYSWFPHLRVTVDGRETAPLRTAGGFMAVHLEAGEHDLTLEAELSPLRRVLLAVNLLYMAATVFLFVDIWRRKRQLR